MGRFVMNINYIEISCCVAVAFFGFFIWLIELRNSEPERHTDGSDPDMDHIIDQMKDDYINGKISLELFEEYVENRLEGRTPMWIDGYPVYYEDHMLNGFGKN